MRPFLFFLAFSLACESQVEHYRRVERERNIAERESRTAKQQYDSLQALLAAGGHDSAETERLEHARSNAAGKAILADARRQDAELELSLMVGQRP